MTWPCQVSNANKKRAANGSPVSSFVVSIAVLLSVKMLLATTSDQTHAKYSHEVAKGCSHGREPMEHREHNVKSRRDERNSGIRLPFRPFAPSGLPRCSCYRIHGLAPKATSFRPFGTRSVRTAPRHSRVGGNPTPRHSRAGGNPVISRTPLESRLRGNDLLAWLTVQKGQ